MDSKDMVTTPEKQEDARQLPNVSFEGEIARFTDHLNSLYDTLPLATNAIQEAKKVAIENFGKFLEKHGELVEENDNSKSWKVFGSFEQVMKIFRATQRPILAQALVPESFIISLISQFDAFIGGLVRVVFLLKPEILNSSEKNISFSELVSFGSVEEARNYIVEKEIETLLREGHADQFKWLENKLGIELRKGLDSWSAFIEITERRNLFVHARGIVSNQYLQNCEKHGYKHLEAVSLGDELKADIDYFNAAYECIYEIGIKLAHVLWRKIAPQDIENADTNLIGVTYDLLYEQKYELAKRILDFATDLKKFSHERSKLVLIVNKAQAYKWSGNSVEALKIIRSKDWTAASDDFLLAEAVICDNFEQANTLVQKIGAEGVMQKDYYREWPLFKEYRETSEFKTIFETIFGESLVVSFDAIEPAQIDEEQAKLNSDNSLD